MRDPVWTATRFLTTRTCQHIRQPHRRIVRNRKETTYSMTGLETALGEKSDVKFDPARRRRSNPWIVRREAQRDEIQ